MERTLQYWIDELEILSETYKFLFKLYEKSSEDEQKFIDIAMRCVLVRQGRIKNFEVDPCVGLID